MAFTHPARKPRTGVVALRRVTKPFSDREAALRKRRVAANAPARISSKPAHRAESRPDA